MAANSHIGMMLMSFIGDGTVKRIGLYETLRLIASMGYHYLEVSQLALTPENVAELKRGAQDFNLQVRSVSASVHASELLLKYGFEDLGNEASYRKLVDLCHELGCKAIRMGATPDDGLKDYDGLMQVCADAEAAAEKLAREDIGFYWHIHNFEFTKIDGKPMVYHLKDNTKLTGFELDTYWIQAGGMVPAEVIRDFYGRCRLIHLKDYRVRRITSLMEDREERVQFAEIGEGNINMPKVIETGISCGCEYFFIEQDKTYGRTAEECARTSYENLVKMGYKALLD